jgi:hypothetical protein
VRQAIAISPLLHPIGFPTWADRALARAFTVLPDHYEWWNATTHEREPGPAYPRYSYRGVTAFLMLGEWADAARHPAAPAEVVLVRNLADPYVDGAYNLDHFRRFAAPGRLRVVTIPAGARLAHDLVGTDGPDPARTRLAYQYLSRAVGFELPDPRGPATAPASFETTDVTEGAR